jgi:NodT family efflux transporter outer membrane factor (OMF) lipoprotein
MEGRPKIRTVAKPIALASCALLAISSAGCTSFRDWCHNGFKVGPNYCPPPASTAAQWIDSDDKRVESIPPNDGDWWSVFNDPTLNDLIDTAYLENLDLKTAGTRILQARSQRAIAVGNLFPQSQRMIADYAHVQLPNTTTLPLPGELSIWATGLNGSWELDFWGRYRRSIEAATADVGAAVEDYHDALVMLCSEVATSYVQLRTYQERLLYAQENVEIQKKSTQLAEERFDKGVATELDVRQARSNLKQTESTIPPLVIGCRQSSDALCTLLGMAPLNLAARLQPAPIPSAPAEIAVGIPADLLRRRPDIRSAERHVAAQCARIGVAEAELYPTFSIDGFLGYASNNFGSLFSAENFTGVVAPLVSWNVLNYGRLLNNVRYHDAQYDEAVFQYQQKVLTAGREVEDSLIGFLQSQQQAISLEQGVAETRRSVDLVVEQFEAGVTDFNRVYNTESLLVTQKDDLAQARGQIATNLIGVYRALGGGWKKFDPGCAGGCSAQPHETLGNATKAEDIVLPKPDKTVSPLLPPIKQSDSSSTLELAAPNSSTPTEQHAVPLPATNSIGP